MNISSSDGATNRQMSLAGPANPDGFNQPGTNQNVNVDVAVTGAALKLAILEILPKDIFV
jgi:hypothetical protein